MQYRWIFVQIVKDLLHCLGNVRAIRGRMMLMLVEIYAFPSQFSLILEISKEANQTRAMINTIFLLAAPTITGNKSKVRRFQAVWSDVLDENNRSQWFFHALSLSIAGPATRSLLTVLIDISIGSLPKILNATRK